MSGRCDDLLDRVRELDEAGDDLEGWEGWLEERLPAEAELPPGALVVLEVDELANLAASLRETAAFLFAMADQIASEARS